MTIVNIEDLRRRARRRLPKVVFDFIDGGAQDEVSLRANRADFEACLQSGLLLADGEVLAFRHELGRVAVESSLSPPVAQDLHRRVLRVLEAPERNGTAARLVHHALRACDQASISRLNART